MFWDRWKVFYIYKKNCKDNFILVVNTCSLENIFLMFNLELCIIFSISCFDFLKVLKFFIELYVVFLFGKCYV